MISRSFNGTEERPSLWRDLRCGEAGFLPRLALSLVMALALAAAAVLVLGVIDVLGDPITRTYTTATGAVTTSYSYTGTAVRDEHIVVALGLAGLVWLLSLTRIWATYARFRHTLRAAFVVLAIWTGTLLLCAVIDNGFSGRGDYLIGGCVLCAFGGSAFVITTTAYRAGRGKPVHTSDGQINLHCPTCGYSMVGLEQPLCPECGTRYTLDELIRRQHYAGAASGGPSSFRGANQQIG